MVAVPAVPHSKNMKISAIATFLFLCSFTLSFPINRRVHQLYKRQWGALSTAGKATVQSSDNIAGAAAKSVATVALKPGFLATIAKRLKNFFVPSKAVLSEIKVAKAASQVKVLDTLPDIKKAQNSLKAVDDVTNVPIAAVDGPPPAFLSMDWLKAQYKAKANWAYVQETLIKSAGTTTGKQTGKSIVTTTAVITGGIGGALAAFASVPSKSKIRVLQDIAAHAKDI